MASCLPEGVPFCCIEKGERTEVIFKKMDCVCNGGVVYPALGKCISRYKNRIPYVSDC